MTSCTGVISERAKYAFRIPSTHYCITWIVLVFVEMNENLVAKVLAVGTIINFTQLKLFPRSKYNPKGDRLALFSYHVFTEMLKRLLCKNVFIVK